MDVKERTVLSVWNSNRVQVKMVGLIGLEPMTPALSRRCSNQLSYRPVWIPWGAFSCYQKIEAISWKMVEVNGFEPLTFCLQSRRSTNWAKPPFTGKQRLRFALPRARFIRGTKTKLCTACQTIAVALDAVTGIPFNKRFRCKLLRAYNPRAV